MVKGARSRCRAPPSSTMEQALKLSWFFLHSTVVPNNDQQQQQTPAFLPRHQTTAIMADHSSSRPASALSNSNVAPPPGGAVFGGHAHHATSRPAFFSQSGSQPTNTDTSKDSRDESGGQLSSAHQYPYYAPPPATFGVTSSIAAEFSPPHSTALRTAPSHDSVDSSTTDHHLTEPMPALPSVPPSSSIHQHHSNVSPQRMHVTFAPPATYHAYGYADPRLGYQYESYQYGPEPATSTTSQQNSETPTRADSHNSNDDQSNSYEGMTVPNNDVTSRDVKFGRGGGTNRHPGNLFFRKLVEDAKPAYMLAKKAEKDHISRSIVSTIRSRGGRWLKLDQQSDFWVDVGDDEAARKVSQALREGLALKRRKALMKSVSASGSRTKKSIARPAYLPSSGVKCAAKTKKQMKE